MYYWCVPILQTPSFWKVEECGQSSTATRQRHLRRSQHSGLGWTQEQVIMCILLLTTGTKESVLIREGEMYALR